MTLEVIPGTFYVKDGTARQVVKVLSVSDTHVTYSWMGIQFSKEIEEFQKHYTYISVPAMGDAQ